ncbi:hypothetical protein Tco_0845847 [Tanacetum coccineum]
MKGTRRRCYWRIINSKTGNVIASANPSNSQDAIKRIANQLKDKSKGAEYETTTFVEFVEPTTTVEDSIIMPKCELERHASGHVFRLGPVWGCDSLVSRAKVIENQVMTISVISISSDSSEGSVGTPAGRVILFGTIPTTIPDTTPVIIPPTTQTDTTVIPTETPIIAPTIPPSPDYTPASPDYSPASDSESDPSEDPSSDHIPPLPATSPFLSSDDDTTDSDSPDTPPSPTHGTPFTEITSSTQRSPVIPRRRVMILAPGQPIPHGRPYRYHLNR